MQNATVHNCSGEVSKKKSILTSKAVFAHHLPRIGVLNGNSDSTGCVHGGREEYAIMLSFLLYIYGFFAAIQACFHLIGVIYARSVGNGS